MVFSVLPIVAGIVRFGPTVLIMIGAFGASYIMFSDDPNTIEAEIVTDSQSVNMFDPANIVESMSDDERQALVDRFTNLNLPFLPDGADMDDAQQLNLYDPNELEYYREQLESEYENKDCDSGGCEHDPDGDPGTGIPGIYEPDTIESDLDPDKKGGGKDPFIIRGTWNYFDFDAERCSNAPNSFDYDNDGFPEHMCYWYTSGSQILFNDRYDGVLVNGTNFIGDFTHIWEDKNMNVFVDEGELIPIVDPQLRMLVKYPDGLRDPYNGRYIYCVGESLTYGWEFDCTKPTYWMTQEWMRD